MKKVIYFIALASILFSCNGKKTVSMNYIEEDSVVSVVDTAVYGKCSDASSMHSLQIITDDGDVMEIFMDPDSGIEVLGGILAGDRLTATYNKSQEGNVATKVINLTTLLGHWTSLDRNFQINEDGSISSNVQAESKPYTAWQMVNAKLVLNADTFDVASLGADSLALENEKGIFVYKRQR